ncbi:MAG: hypothetical protein HON90_16130 [Halobacteriovoraceae bacterium]|jgi:hypothetical protein|nr:hypothetical protein [Halobacteriovoraceae bacterium]
MKVVTFFFCLLIGGNVIARPKFIEVWFLSIDRTSQLLEIIRPALALPQFAQASIQCQPMGDYCFDPQIGLYKRGEESKVKDFIDLTEIEKKQNYNFLAPHKGVERNLIECDENSGFFDIFCGKAKKIKSKAKIKLELWFDTSSTLRQIDPGGFDKFCKRELFLDTLSKSCRLNEKMKVYYFDESRKEAGNFERVCVSDGLNNMKRIVSDLRESKAEHVIIVTDIFEAEESFINAIEQMGSSTIKGLDKPVYARDLKKEISRIQKICQ